jgi:hypothetical protein
VDVIHPAVQKIAFRVIERGDHAPADDLHRLQEKLADEEVANCGKNQHGQKLKTLPENRARLYSGFAPERGGRGAGRY